MTILVTGARGQVGRALAKLGAERQLSLVALDRSQLDITSDDSIAQAFAHYSPEVVINAAAYTAVDKAESEPELASAANEAGVGLLACACAEAKIPLIHVSTDYVFDGSKLGPYTEDDPVNPKAVYARSKEAGERLVRQYAEQHIILRTSWVFSEHGSNFVKTMLRLAKDRDRLTVVADQFGGPTSARAIAATLIQIVQKIQGGEDITWGTYHFSQAPYVSWCQFAQAIVDHGTACGLIDHPVKVDPITSADYPTPVERPKNSRLDVRKIESSIGVATSEWDQDVLRVVALMQDSNSSNRDSGSGYRDE